MRVAELPPTMLTALRTRRYDESVEKHEGPNEWRWRLDWVGDDAAEQAAEILEVDDFQVLLPIPVTHHAYLEIERVLPSADGTSLTLLVADYTYAPADRFRAGRLAVCERWPGTDVYVAIAYHAMFFDDTVLWGTPQLTQRGAPGGHVK